MKYVVLAIIVISLYLIKRLTFSGQAGKRQGNETPPVKPSDEYEAVVKNRFFLPEQSNSKQHGDRKDISDIQDRKPHIFAAGNDTAYTSVIPSDELDEVFGEDVNPDELDIEPDDEEDDTFDAEEETEEIRLSAGEIEGYADGFTYDELATVIHDAGNQPEKMTTAGMETLRNLAQTDLFERIVSSGAGMVSRIAFILDRHEQNFMEDNDTSDEKYTEYQDYDIEQFVSE